MTVVRIYSKCALDSTLLGNIYLNDDACTKVLLDATCINTIMPINKGKNKYEIGNICELEDHVSHGMTYTRNIHI